ncbi:EAL domain-containing protein [Solirubrobacter taibaiensis]|nr:EAL domain-containing protein [Solirubrobacter taibaiensis]
MNIDYAALFSAVPSPCLIVTADLEICDVNQAYLDAAHRRREDLIGRRLFDAFPDNPDDPRADGARNVRASLERALRTGCPDTLAVQQYDIAVGDVFEERWWSVVNTPVKDADGRVTLLMQTVEDVTHAQQAALALERSERRFRSFVEHAADAIIVLGLEGDVIYASPATSVITGRPVGAGLRWSEIVHPDDVGAALRLVGAAEAGSGEAACGRLRVLGADGTLRYVDVRVTDHRDDVAICGLVLNVRDVTEEQQAERTLQRQALEDALTATPNRRWFLEAAKHASARALRNGTPLGVVLVDVDRFKLINDTMGHPAGDQLLIQLTRRMAGALRPSDTVARLGGDEFAILSEDLRSEHDAWQIAQRVAEAATGLYDVGPGLEARVTLSIGLCTDDGSADADTLLAHADAALYKAKREGRNRIEVFDPELRRALVHRVRVEHELHRALRDDEFVLHWQPIIRTRDETIVGAEALLRWQHPERGLLAPAAFLPIAEEAGLMHTIGAWAIDRALAQAVRWQQMEERPRVFVNLAAEQLRVPSLPDEVAQLALRYAVPPEDICFEVSERSLDADLAALREQLLLLRGYGFGLALDDFGAGNTALAWLQQLPLDVLKLDRRFTATVEDPTAQAIIRAIVDLGPALGVTTVAEGVESPSQLATLRRLGCDFAQGYEIAEPQSARRVSQRFRRRVSAELQP